MSKENRVSDELEHGQYWVRFGSGQDWEVMRWDGDWFWGSAGDGYKRDSFEVGPQVFPPNSLRSKPVASGAAECIEALKQELEKPIEGPEHGAWDRGKRDGLQEAISILSALLPQATAPVVSEPVANKGEQRTICEACGNSNLAHDRAVWTDDGSSFCPSCVPQPEAVITEEWLRDTAMNVMLATEVEEATSILRSALTAAMKEA